MKNYSLPQKLYTVICIVVLLFLLLPSCSKTEANSTIIPSDTTVLGDTTFPNEDESKFTVLQFNIWQEGTQVPNGYQSIIDEIARYQPDFVSLVEVRNYNNVDFLDKVCKSLSALGLTYYARFSDDCGIISKHEIKSFAEIGSKNYIYKIVSTVNNKDIAFYTSHLDYTHYAEYFPRGYDGDGYKMSSPIVDKDLILAEDAKSTRRSAISDFLADAKAEIGLNRAVVLAGDFNEASFLDWTDKTKNLYDHNGAVIPWPASSTLYGNGFKDAYRMLYPDELTYPGFTWVVANPWIKDADERDRIDFIYYFDNGKIAPVSASLIGPKQIYVGSQPISDTTKDPILAPQGAWPSDHRALILKFKLD